MVDLHVHTNKSDGELSPEGVVKLAKKEGLKTIAVTDHDTIEGLKEALTAGQKLNMRVIPGIELSTVYKNKDLHILGLGVNYKNLELQNTAQKLKNARIKSAELMISKLRRLGFEVSMSEVSEITKGVIGSLHVAEAVIKNKKNWSKTKGLNKVFFTKKFLIKGKPAHAKVHKINAIDAIKIIKKAGGIPVLAHPSINLEESETPIILELAKHGLEGVEVYNNKQSITQTKFYTRLAKKNSLLVSGGSDYHGIFFRQKIGKINNKKIPLNALNDILKKLR